MSKDPAFMFYSADFLIGVMDMTMEERGQYISLMCLQHQKGHLSEETIRLCVGSVSDKVMSKFQLDEKGLYYSDRLDEEIEKRAKFVKCRQENGKKGGRPKRTETDRFSVGLPTDNLLEDEDVNGNEDASGVEIDDENGNVTPTSKLPPCPFEKIKELYNSICASYPKIRAIDGKRRDAVAARWRAYKSIDVFREVFEIAEASSFMKGQSDSSWTADFDWMMKPTNMAKILEHKYDDKPSARQPQATGALAAIARLREECED